jgi:hypothetical protein
MYKHRVRRPSVMRKSVPKASHFLVFCRIERVTMDDSRKKGSESD